MEDVFQNLSFLDQWNYKSTDDSSFKVAELWLQKTSGKISVKSQTVEAGGINRWLSQRTRGLGDQEESVILRVIWAEISVLDKTINISEAVQDELLGKLGLKVAHGYSRSLISGVTAFPPRSSNPALDSRAYSICYVPKLAALWSHTRSITPDGPPPITNCIMFVQRDEKAGLQQCLNMSWDLNICRNPMFPAFALALLLGTQIDKSNGDIKVQIRKIEKRTGYSTFTSRQADKPAEEELGELSAQTSGSAAKLASTMRKTKSLERVLDWILKMLAEEESRMQQIQTQRGGILDAEQSTQEGSDLLKSHVDILRERSKNQFLDTEYTLKRTEVQVHALFSIITQQDSLRNLALAQDTHAIAYHSYRDSSSMKTLAVVTMFFLPGSFISALFSTACFDWEAADKHGTDIGVRPTSQFRLYWAITIPLTLMTFTLYFLWLYIQKRDRDRKLEGKAAALNYAQSEKERNLEEAEGHYLARRRRTMDPRVQTMYSTWNTK
ncbi:hypothetical protein JDV02_006877 [Purpureocillium takamizusanense]|uniref:Uncharacterized protein n=1 Tax=Purpureocillium takamizusanense TaxID=2060973 RepID=A0A9Q8VBS2_9HYPO|nr:uncharacterized protein JDV02_006877 [Purpureocillium takamizusanense]UNI20825.1 hypothetical protein JDV02_006877 [Purpureocillium takamizusanense]